MKVAVGTEEGVELILDQAVTMLSGAHLEHPGEDYYTGIFDGTVMALECLLHADEERADKVLERPLSSAYIKIPQES